MREKLIELLQCSPSDIMGNHGIGALADHLIANDVVPVVRCKDCKHFRHEDDRLAQHCRLLGAMTGVDDFCSYGERRDGE